MTFQTDYWAIMQAIKTAVETVPGFKTVFFGDKTTNPNFPQAAIVPGDDLIEYESTGYALHHIGFLVWVIDENTTPETLVENTIKRAADVYDALMADITLGGTSDGLFPKGFKCRYGERESKIVFGVINEFQADLRRLEVDS